MVNYGFCYGTIEDLSEMMHSLNRYQDKIIAVTQNGNLYTVFYEHYDNEKGRENNG